MSGEVIVTETDNGASFHISREDLLIFSLPETPTTGYRWELEPAGSDCFSVIRDRFASSNIQPGAAGIRSISLKPKMPCHAKIGLRLRRGWEEQGTALRTIAVEINVD